MTNYELYTVPRCEECVEVKSLLNNLQVSYSESNLRTPEGKKVFGKIYVGIADKLRKNNQNKAILPLLVKRDGNGGVEKFGQGLEEITDRFG
tara:strand:- start:219 stop:494 length:276 start_codon:yes stop_codon:yes gene_type:complete